MVFSFPLAFFPKRLPKQNTDAIKLSEAEKLNDAVDGNDPGKVFKQTSSEFWEAFKRLLTNKIFMYNFFSSLVTHFDLSQLDQYNKIQDLGMPTG